MAIRQGSEQAMKRHAALLHRATMVLACLNRKTDLVFRDESDATPPLAAATIGLSRARQPRLIRGRAPGSMAIAYDHPESEAALGALLAASLEKQTPVAADPESLSIISLAERLAGTDIPVLINGPTGTGKEVLSHFIHNRSPRARGPFIAVNCAAMPESMLESLLFGHQKGSFTGANVAGKGFFRAANGGTLLLDEIAEMPIGLQAKLLRALQEGEVVPLGATQPVKVDVRVIACANRDLPLEVEEGRFRPDLFYRLNVFPLALRPLRERVADVAPLAFALALRHCGTVRPIPWISDDTITMLKLHGWPGNVRELENVIRRALLLADGSPVITPQHIVFDQNARLSPPAALSRSPSQSHVTSSAPSSSRARSARSSKRSLPAVRAG